MMTLQTKTAMDTNAAMAAMTGLARGTLVITLSGMRPVEKLKSGERIVTRSGATVLKTLRKMGTGYELEFDVPEVVYLADGQICSDTCLPFAA